MAIFHCIVGHVHKRNERGENDPHSSLADPLAALDLTVQQSLATMGSHPDPSLNTNTDHGDNREGSERCPGPYEGNFEEFAIYTLQRLSTHPDWRQRVSDRNEGGQTMAHICVFSGHRRLLQQLIGWEIDLNAVDNNGLTALHFAYFFNQPECARLLTQSGANQFILDDLGRSPSDLDPSLEVSLHSDGGP